MSAVINLSPCQASHVLPSTILCFSHLRWDFVFQRPQQLLTRLTSRFNIFYIEEPVFYSGTEPCCLKLTIDKNVTIVVPHISSQSKQPITDQRKLLSDWIETANIQSFMSWYYTPMALQFTRHLQPDIVVYDCMDELSAFKFAPQSLLTLEAELLNLADIVFTGGSSLYNAKKGRHGNVHLFPSSIDEPHFAKAKQSKTTPADQQKIKSPILGFFGVIDERFDIDLIADVAKQRPSWQLVLIGPIVKIDAETLPKNENIHYLGSKKYEELPHYLAGWDAAMIPFALNESTRFISPTKTPEYLAAGIPVISTPIADVVNPYGMEGLVNIAQNSNEFIEAAENLFERGVDLDWEKKVSAHLSTNSWDKTVITMVEKLQGLKTVISN